MCFFVLISWDGDNLYGFCVGGGFWGYRVFIGKVFLCFLISWRFGYLNEI